METILIILGLVLLDLLFEVFFSSLGFWAGMLFSKNVIKSGGEDVGR